MKFEEIKIGMRVCTRRKGRVCPGTVIAVSPRGFVKVKRDNGYVGTPWAKNLHPFDPPPSASEILEATLDAFARTSRET